MRDIIERKSSKQKNNHPKTDGYLAGETRFEHATDGFGDRDSTVELLP